MYQNMNISAEVINYSEEILKNLEERFKEIDRIAEYNQLKVIKAMQDNKVAEAHFQSSSGYGYNDMGRDIRMYMQACFMRSSLSKTADYLRNSRS